MLLKLEISGADNTAVNIQSFSPKDVLKFLKDNDHEGASTDLDIFVSNEEVYEVLELLNEANNSRF